MYVCDERSDALISLVASDIFCHIHLRNMHASANLNVDFYMELKTTVECEFSLIDATDEGLSPMHVSVIP